MSTHATGLYRERLIPGVWVWVVALGLVIMVAVAYGAALGATVGWLTALGASAVAITLLWLGAPVVVVTPQAFTAGGAQLPRDAIGAVRIVEADEIAALRGPGADARLYVSLRPSASRRGLLVQVTDDQDPHPAWLVTVRHPERAAAALTATMDVTEHPRLEE